MRSGDTEVNDMSVNDTGGTQVRSLQRQVRWRFRSVEGLGPTRT